jgi:WD40 repeat protein
MKYRATVAAWFSNLFEKALVSLNYLAFFFFQRVAAAFLAISRRFLADILAGEFGGTVHIWDLATGALRRTLRDHSKSVTAVAVTPDGALVVSGLPSCTTCNTIAATTSRASPTCDDSSDSMTSTTIDSS